MLFPENIGLRLSIDEVAVTNGELYTVLTNKAAHGKQGALVAMMEGTKVGAMTPILATIPFEKRTLVTEVTLDMSESMNAMVKQAFPNATLVLDRFHVQRLVSEAVQEIRIGSSMFPCPSSSTRTSAVAPCFFFTADAKPA